MCNDEKKLRFILSDYSITKEVKQACFESFRKIWSISDYRLQVNFE